MCQLSSTVSGRANSAAVPPDDVLMSMSLTRRRSTSDLSNCFLELAIYIYIYYPLVHGLNQRRRVTVWKQKNHLHVCQLDVCHQCGRAWAAQLSHNIAKFRFFALIVLSRCLSQSFQMSPVIHAFPLALYSTGRVFTFLKHLGFLLLPITGGLSFSLPSMLYAKSRVMRSFATFEPSASSDLNDNVPSGIAVRQ